MTTTPAATESKRTPFPPRFRQVEQFVFALALLTTIVLIGVKTWLLIPGGSPSAVIAGSHRLIDSDADIGMIYAALRLKSTFLSTFAWWHEKWAGPFNYWRPLTSQFFWLEYHAFGPDRFDRWMTAMAVSHLLFTGLLAVLIARLTGNRWIGLLTAYLFAGARQVGPFSVWLFGYIPSAATTEYWKNEPEVWAGICAIGAMLLALSGRWAFAVALAAASIGFKESGWLTWPLVFLALVPGERYQQIPRWTYAAGLGICAVLFAFRCTISGDIYAGNHATHNVNWLGRYWGQVGGLYFTDLTTTFAPLAVWSLALATIVRLRRIPVLGRVAMMIAAFGACAAWYGIASGSDFAAGIAIFLDWDGGLSHWLFDLAYVFCALCLVTSREYRLVATVLLAMDLLSALPVVASVLVGNHTLYLTYGLQSALVALMLAATIETIARWARSLKTDSLLPKPKENTA